MGKVVTDPALIARLEAMSGGQPAPKPKKVVTDPELIKRLENGETDFSFGEMVSNIPSSAAQFGKDIIQPFMHPIDTAKGVGNLVLGGLDKGAEALADAVPEDIGKSINQFNNWLVDKGLPLERLPDDPKDMTYQNKQYADAMTAFIKDRYGSMDAAKKTVMNDPVGALADLSAVVTGGATAATKVPLLGAKGGAVNAIGKGVNAIQKTGAAMEPVNLIKNTAIAPTAKMLPKTMPANLYDRAAKFSTTLAPEKRAKITQTALDAGIMPNSQGLARLNSMITVLGDQIDSLVDAADKTGAKIPKRAVLRNLKQVRQDMGGPKLFGKKDRAAIDKIAKDFDQHMTDIGRDYLTPSELQAFKQDIYKHVNFDRDYMKADLPAEEASKAIARAAKESLEGIKPEIKGLNQQQGDLLELVKPIERSAARIENRNIIPFGTPFNVAAGGAAANVPGALAGAGASLLSLPKVQAGSGIALNRWQRNGLMEYLNNPLGLTMGQQALYQSGRGTSE